MVDPSRSFERLQLPHHSEEGQGLGGLCSHGEAEGREKQPEKRAERDW